MRGNKVNYQPIDRQGQPRGEQGNYHRPIDEQSQAIRGEHDIAGAGRGYGQRISEQAETRKDHGMAAGY